MLSYYLLVLLKILSIISDACVNELNDHSDGFLLLFFIHRSALWAWLVVHDVKDYTHIWIIDFLKFNYSRTLKKNFFYTFTKRSRSPIINGPADITNRISTRSLCLFIYSMHTKCIIYFLRVLYILWISYNNR